MTMNIIIRTRFYGYYYIHFSYACTKVYLEYWKSSLVCFFCSTEVTRMLVGRLQGRTQELAVGVIKVRAKCMPIFKKYCAFFDINSSNAEISSFTYF